MPSPNTLMLLAAGRGTRFGSDKRQHHMATGLSLLNTTLALYQNYYDHLVIVLRPGDEPLAQAVPLHPHNHRPIDFVYAELAEQGMGHSLASGARFLLDNNKPKIQPAPPASVTVALADMPYVKPNTLESLQAKCASLNAPFIVQPSYQGKPGNPVAFSSNYLPAFTKLHGDQGARAIVRSQPDALHWIAVEDPGILHDIDQPKDIQA